MEPKRDDSSTSSGTTTEAEEGAAHNTTSGDAVDMDTTDDATQNVNDSNDPASDVAMTDAFYFDVGRSNKKRKSPGLGTTDSETSDPLAAGSLASNPSKKARLDVDNAGASLVSNGQVKDKSLLPPEIWHHIFTLCPPKTLGNLLRVNKLFHHYISPSSSTQPEYPSSALNGVLGPLKPNNILVASRRLFWPHMPAPLRSMSELDMWRLLCSKRCQECDKLDARGQQLPTDNVHDGPGMEGVSVVWPLGIRVCGLCLLKKTVKVRSLFPHAIVSLRVAALPPHTVSYCLG